MKKTGPGPGFFKLLSRVWLRSERQMQCAQVFAGFDQHQRTFVHHQCGWTLAWHAHGGWLGRDGGLHRSDFGAVRVHPHQAAVMNDLLEAVDGQCVIDRGGHGLAGCFGCGGAGSRHRRGGWWRSGLGGCWCWCVGLSCRRCIGCWRCLRHGGRWRGSSRCSVLTGFSVGPRRSRSLLGALEVRAWGRAVISRGLGAHAAGLG